MDKNLLFGYSRAPDYDYIPTSYEELHRKLGRFKDRTHRTTTFTYSYEEHDLAQQLIDCYGKIGFLMIAKDYIQQENSLRDWTHDPHYHLYNLIFDAKAFLDSVSVLLNDFYSIGRSNGEIDLKWPRFRELIMEKEPLLTKIIKKNERWIEDVVRWREAIIHKFSIPLGFSADSTELLSRKRTSPLLMLIEPKPYLFSKFEELEEKHGSAWQPVEAFCEVWIKSACELFDAICSTISVRIPQKKGVD